MNIFRYRHTLFLLGIFLILLASSCASRKKMVKKEAKHAINITPKQPSETNVPINKPKTEVIDPLIMAENTTSEAGKLVLEVGRKMALVDKTIVKGSCWDYINTVFNTAGCGANKQVVFKSKKSGPYADISTIQPGDWLYYVNYSYGGVEHSGIFVYWEDYERKIGVTLSYGGENRNEPGRYKSYDLKSVYYITRPMK